MISLTENLLPCFRWFCETICGEFLTHRHGLSPRMTFSQGLLEFGPPICVPWCRFVVADGTAPDHVFFTWMLPPLVRR